MNLHYILPSGLKRLCVGDCTQARRVSAPRDAHAAASVAAFADAMHERKIFKGLKFTVTVQCLQEKI